MLNLKNWGYWELKTVTDKNGKTRQVKYPYQVNGQGAKSNDPSTWTDIKTVCDFIIRNKDRDLGLAFFLPLDESLNFVDLDSYGVFDDEFKLMEKLAPCYMESSQSGNGWHVIFKGKKPGTRKRTPNFEGKHHEIEWYTKGRFIALTTEVWNIETKARCELSQLSNEDCLKIYEMMFGKGILEKDSKPKTVNKSTGVVKLTETDSELLRIMFSSRRGDDIKSLYYGGWEYNYQNDRSRADLALCNHLAYWTQKDPLRMDKLFRNSCLYRDKWDEQHGALTYGEMTVAKAIDNTDMVFKETSVKSKLDYMLTQYPSIGREYGYIVTVVRLAQQDSRDLTRIKQELLTKKGTLTSNKFNEAFEKGLK